MTRQILNLIRSLIIFGLPLILSPQLGQADLSNVARLTSGQNFTCSVSLTGGMKCWGYNFNGQLGDGTTTNSSVAVDVSGLTTGVAEATTGESHTCALTTSGGVKCWGSNSSGQIGDGTTVQRSVATDVTGLSSGISAISAGSYHTCALTTSAGIKCWGANSYGQIGDGTTTQRNTATDVSGLTEGVSGIEAGSSHSCALVTTGGIKCWGTALLGDSSSSHSSTPVDVVGLNSSVA